jgi:hypothetical protein
VDERRVQILLLLHGGVLLLGFLDVCEGDGDLAIVLVRVIERCVLDDLANGLGSGGPSLPVLVAQVRDDSAEDVEQLIRMLFLPVGKLVDSGVSDETGAAGLEDPEGVRGRGTKGEGSRLDLRNDPLQSETGLSADAFGFVWTGRTYLEPMAMFTW